MRIKMLGSALATLVLVGSAYADVTDFSRESDTPTIRRRK
jgi:hypothetical protein